MKVVLFANTDWYLYNFRLPLAKALRAAGHEVVLMSPHGAYGARLVQAGFRWLPLPFSRSGINPAAELATILKVAAAYQRERPDLVHHFTIKCVLYGSIAARLTAGSAIVNAVTGLGHLFTDQKGARAGLLKLIVRTLYRLALRGTQVIFQNPDDMHVFEDQGLLQGAGCHLIRGSGVNTELFRPMPETQRAERPVVLFASRLLRAKGIAEFVEAAALVRAQRPEVRFVAAGDIDPGNPSSVPRETVEIWRARGDVEFPGHLDDMKPLLASAALVALPSYREGTPRILLEAAACGLPLVATDVPGCREVVRSGLNGLLVPVRDSAALARAIAVILADAQLASSMGQESRKIAVAEFSEEQVITRTLGVYGRAESARAARP